MSFRTITLASIYELQGFKNEALEIYKDILKKDPDNKEAQDAYKRLKNTSKTFEGVNIKAKDFFIKTSTHEELKTFERWLMQWN
ncbi:tetratricopeptide repeat protein [Helicobacter cappadocius]|uniref:Tetratricopeptide repeat protein n=1 Tax=Helicobacter cappadocius TaxID=3063998 RepID=A0AA90PK75_9HELI|nr:MULTISPECIES: hypothetical protein [unclassified Helicobacter]MDO7253794.1 hypothetical protein [Helicobacter sp. faydin-H75]MDP2538674.1 hypothetical protein [Helicobacter sp. faydin-H76]